MPLIAPSAQIRYLKRLGLIVNRKPNGKPLVARGEVERVLVGPRPAVALIRPGGQPNREALLELLSRREIPKAKKAP